MNSFILYCLLEVDNTVVDAIEENDNLKWLQDHDYIHRSYANGAYEVTDKGKRFLEALETVLSNG